MSQKPTKTKIFPTYIVLNFGDIASFIKGVNELPHRSADTDKVSYY